ADGVPSGVHRGAALRGGSHRAGRRLPRGRGGAVGRDLGPARAAPRSFGTMTTSNPLLSEDFRIPFDRILPEHVEPGIREILRRGQERLDRFAADESPPTWDNTLAALDEITR